jgi:hypothetical protein
LAAVPGVGPALLKDALLGNALGNTVAFGVSLGAGAGKGASGGEGVYFGPNGEIGVYVEYGEERGLIFGASASVSETWVFGSPSELAGTDYVLSASSCSNTSRRASCRPRSRSF